jgi:hypothetical protein
MKSATIGILSLLICAGICFSTVIPVNATKEQVRGTWIGFASDTTDSFRLVLKDGTGWLSWKYASDTPNIYKIDSWTLGSKARMIAKISPVSTNAEPIVIEGHAESYKLELKIMGPWKEKGWVQEATFYREETIEGKIQALKEAMKRLN